MIRLADDLGIPAGWRMELTVGKAVVGSVYWNGGAYYPVTQVRRFGAVENLDRARALVETWGVYDVLTYPVAGNA
jgi:hypothetical protein